MYALLLCSLCRLDVNLAVSGTAVPQFSMSEVRHLKGGAYAVAAHQFQESQEQKQRINVWNEAIQDLLRVEADVEAAEPSTAAKPLDPRCHADAARDKKADGGNISAGDGKQMPAVAGKKSAHKVAVAAKAGSGKPHRGKAEEAQSEAARRQATLNGTTHSAEQISMVRETDADRELPSSDWADFMDTSADSPQQQNGYRNGNSTENGSPAAYGKQTDEAREALLQVCQEEFLAQSRPAKRTRLKAAEEEQDGVKRQKQSQQNLRLTGDEYDDDLPSDDNAEAEVWKASQQNDGKIVADGYQNKGEENVNGGKAQETANSALQEQDSLAAQSRKLGLSDSKDAAGGLEDLLAAADELLNEI